MFAADFAASGSRFLLTFQIARVSCRIVESESGRRWLHHLHKSQSIHSIFWPPATDLAPPIIIPSAEQQPPAGARARDCFLVSRRFPPISRSTSPPRFNCDETTSLIKFRFSFAALFQRFISGFDGSRRLPLYLTTACFVCERQERVRETEAHIQTPQIPPSSVLIKITMFSSSLHRSYQTTYRATHSAKFFCLRTGMR